MHPEIGWCHVVIPAADREWNGYHVSLTSCHAPTPTLPCHGHRSRPSRQHKLDSLLHKPDLGFENGGARILTVELCEAVVDWGVIIGRYVPTTSYQDGIPSLTTSLSIHANASRRPDLPNVHG